STPIAAFELDRLRVLALFVHVALGLHLSGLCEGYRRRVEFFLPFLFRRNGFGPLLPLCWDIRVPINPIAAARQSIEGNQTDHGRGSTTFRAEFARLACDGLEPLVDGHRRRD